MGAYAVQYTVQLERKLVTPLSMQEHHTCQSLSNCYLLSISPSFRCIPNTFVCSCNVYTVFSRVIGTAANKNSKRRPTANAHANRARHRRKHTQNNRNNRNNKRQRKHRNKIRKKKGKPFKSQTQATTHTHTVSIDSEISKRTKSSKALKTAEAKDDTIDNETTKQSQTRQPSLFKEHEHEHEHEPEIETMPRSKGISKSKLQFKVRETANTLLCTHTVYILLSQTTA